MKLNVSSENFNSTYCIALTTDSTCKHFVVLQTVFTVISLRSGSTFMISEKAALSTNLPLQCPTCYFQIKVYSKNGFGSAGIISHDNLKE